MQVIERLARLTRVHLAHASTSSFVSWLAGSGASGCMPASRQRCSRQGGQGLRLFLLSWQVPPWGQVLGGRGSSVWRRKKIQQARHAGAPLLVAGWAATPHTVQAGGWADWLAGVGGRGML